MTAVWLLGTIESVTLLVCLPLKSPLNSYHHLWSRVFDKILSLRQIGSGQALVEPMYFLTAPTMFTIGNTIILFSVKITILTYVISLLCQCCPNLIMTLGRRAPSCTIWCIIAPYQKPCDGVTYFTQDSRFHMMIWNLYCWSKMVHYFVK